MNNIEKKLVDYFNGFLTDEENVIVKQWAESNADNNDIYIKAKKVFDSSAVSDSNFTPDVDAAWKSVDSKIKDQNSTINFKLFYRVAAAILIAVGVGYFSILNSNTNDAKTITVSTGNNETKEALLPDGTVVTINKNSTLKYPEFFEVDERNVSLIGQAFFDVKRDEDATFRIRGENTVVSVLGTAFDMMSSNNYSEVNVIRGSVEVVSDINQESVILIKNQRAIVQGNRLNSFGSIDRHSLAWRSTELDFKSATLTEVSHVLSEHFDVKVLVAENIKTCRITSEMSNMSLSEILEVLEAIADIKSSILDQQISLTGPSC